MNFINLNQPKKAVNGRYRYEYIDKIRETGSIAANGEEEYPSDGIPARIENIVKKCDQTGIPTSITFKFYNSSNEIVHTIDLKILPTIVDMNKHNKQFVSEFTAFARENDTVDLTIEESKKHPKEFEKAVQRNINRLVTYVKRNIAIQYLLTKRQHPNPDNKVQNKLDFLGNLTIVRPYNLLAISKENIIPKRLTTLDYSLSDEQAEQRDHDAIVKFSQEIQSDPTINAGLAYASENESVVGLLRGRTPEEIAKNARIDANEAKHKFDIEFLNEQIYSRYLHDKVLERPQMQ